MENLPSEQTPVNLTIHMHTSTDKGVQKSEHENKAVTFICLYILTIVTNELF